jgi:YbbR domain-containing protein
MGWLLRNWTLKIGALGLAMVLYTGLVYSGSFAEDTMRGIPVRGVDQPNTYVNIGPPFRTVDVRYRVGRDQARPTVDSFSAAVDLSKYDTQRAGEPQLLPITVSALGQGVTVLSYTPTQLSVTLDTLDTKTVPVAVDRGTVPDGLEIGPPHVAPEEVQVKGASSRIGQVTRAMAHVSIDASGISVDREFDLVPVDVDGQRVEGVELSPNSVHISIGVNAVQTNKTVPVRPKLDGAPAAGSEIDEIVVDPVTVTLEGAPDELGAITEIATEGIDIGGATKSAKYTAALVVPDGAALVDGSPEQATVTVGVRAANGSRTFVTGVVCRGAGGNACLPSLEQVAVTLSGPIPTLDAVDGGSLTAFLDVSGLGAGSHDVQVTVSVPDGLKLVGVSPATVRVEIRSPTTAPTPSPTLTP